MLEQYKKTLIPTQILIMVVTVAVLIWSHRIAPAFMFFVAMQLGAVLGARWGVRLKYKIERASVGR